MTENLNGTNEDIGAANHVAGVFITSLTRNNKQIRTDRAEAIGEDSQLVYRRRVEDLEMKLKRLQRDRENAMDLAPDNIGSLKPAANFDADKFADNDIALSIEIRNTEIAIDVAKNRYNLLFVGE